MEGRNSTNLRQECLDNSILLFCLGAVWIGAAYLGGTWKLPNISILIFLLGTTLIKPIIRIVRQMLNLDKNPQSEKTSMVVSCMTIGITMGLMIVFFPFVENINIFFPAFTLILGIVFAVSGQVTGSKTYWLIALTLISVSIYSWFFHLAFFSPGGYLAGMVLLGFGGISRSFPEILKLFPTEDNNKHVSVKPSTVSLK